MPTGDLLNWDFIMPKYTDKQREKILRELEKRKQQKKRKEQQEEGDVEDGTIQ